MSLSDKRSLLDTRGWEWWGDVKVGATVTELTYRRYSDDGEQLILVTIQQVSSTSQMVISARREPRYPRYHVDPLTIASLSVTEAMTADELAEFVKRYHDLATSLTTPLPRQCVSSRPQTLAA